MPRGRPKKLGIESTPSIAAPQTSNPDRVRDQESFEERNARIRARRDAGIRTPINEAMRLHFTGLDPNFRYYLAADRGSDLQKMEDSGYEYVTDESGRVQERPAGQGQRHFLMRIPKQYYEADKLRQRELNAKRMESLNVLKKGEYLASNRSAVLEPDADAAPTPVSKALREREIK